MDGLPDIDEISLGNDEIFVNVGDGPLPWVAHLI